MWGPDGALCIGTPRVQGQFDVNDIVCPDGSPPVCDELQAQSFFDLAGTIWIRVDPP